MFSTDRSVRASDSWGGCLMDVRNVLNYKENCKKLREILGVSVSAGRINGVK